MKKFIELKEVTKHTPLMVRPEAIVSFEPHAGICTKIGLSNGQVFVVDNPFIELKSLIINHETK